MPSLLNLGCGSRFCPDESWTNIDFVSGHKRVIAHDLLTSIPFAADTFDAVYHSHVLEHFALTDGRRLIDQCRRVLKPGGMMRVAVPDLAEICRLYLEALAGLESGKTEFQGRYDWMMLELYDQVVRVFPGGEMANYLRRRELSAKDFIIARIGNVGREIIGAAGNEEAIAPHPPVAMRRWICRIRLLPGRLRQKLKLSLLDERERRALAVGLFRSSGEVHHWMYDVYSLRRLLESAGFIEVRRCSATQSRIENWADFHLDVGLDGAEHAPSSLYMEGRKP